MKALKPSKVLAFNWYLVIDAFAEHTGMSFHSQGCWNLDYSKVAGEPNFDGLRILRHEQDYLYPFDGAVGLRDEAGDLKDILTKADKDIYTGKEYYKIDFHVVIRYLIFHGILPYDQFIVTNITLIA